MTQHETTTRHLSEAAALYGVRAEDLRRVADGFQNTVYEYDKQGHSYILRLTSPEHRTPEQIRGELDVIRHLAAGGLGVSVAVPSVHGREVETLPGAHVTSFAKAPGRLVDVSRPEEWNSGFFRTWGQTIGQLHALGKKYVPSAPVIKRPTWQETAASVMGLVTRLGVIDETLVPAYRKQVSLLAATAQDADTFGLIHNDLHQGNFFVQNGALTIFDFDDCMYSWFANDLAVTYYHAYWQSTSFRPDWKTFAQEFMHHFLDGYAATNALPQATIRLIPTFLKVREVFLYVLFHERWDLANLQDWQTYTLQNLQHNIAHDIPYSSLDFSRF